MVEIVAFLFFVRYRGHFKAQNVKTVPGVCRLELGTVYGLLSSVKRLAADTLLV